MKLKTTELQGEALAWAVADCEGELSQHGGQVHLVESKVRFYEDTLDIQYTPPTDWSQGGPIIERERIATWFERYEDEDAGLPCWFAAKYCEREYPGPTPLIAAMRCYVASRVGDEIELPEELKEVMA